MKKTSLSHFKPLRRALLASAAALAALGGAPAMAQHWPDKPIRVIVPYAAGQGADVLMRLVGQELSVSLGQPVIIDNKAGAGGNVGTDMVAKSKPDGYTLLFGTAATHGINVSLYKNLPYDPLKDFEPITLAMARDQDLPANPMRISGACGRLMCCLKYEHPLYQDFKATAPAIGEDVETPAGPGRVVGHSVPGESVVVKLAADGTRQVCPKASVCGSRKAYESRDLTPG